MASSPNIAAISSTPSSLNTIATGTVTCPERKPTRFFLAGVGEFTVGIRINGFPAWMITTESPCTALVMTNESGGWTNQVPWSLRVDRVHHWNNETG